MTLGKLLTFCRLQSHLQSGGAPLQGLVKFKSKISGTSPSFSGPPVSGRFYCHFIQSEWDTNKITVNSGVFLLQLNNPG